MAQTEEKPALRLTRHFNASPEKVWQAWTDPQALRQWFGPGEISSVPVAEIDLRVGGRFHVLMLTEAGEEHDVNGIYQEVVPLKKLRFSWYWKSTPERVSMVTITLKPAGKGTEMDFRHEQFFNEEARTGHEHGWTGSFKKLEAMLN
jgi:uncharacterized protein YndB with AHSA1/START domain